MLSIFWGGFYVVCLSLFVLYPCRKHTFDGEYRCTNSWDGFIIWAGHPQGNFILSSSILFCVLLVLYSIFFTDYSVGLCYFQDKKTKVKVVYARGRKPKVNEDRKNTKVSTVAATASRKESSTSDVAVQKEKACKQKGKAVATKQNEAVEVNIVLSYFFLFCLYSNFCCHKIG
jgi:hypothetical protein